jgi:excisionase family DNA binding protein
VFEPAVFGTSDDSRKWVVAANAIAERLADGRYPPGEWLPPLAEMGTEMGMSAATLYAALKELGAKGLVTHVRKTGFFPGDRRPARPPERLHGTAADQPPSPASPRIQSQNPLAEDYVTVRELATRLRVGLMTVYRLAAAGEIDGVVRFGKSWRIPESGVRAYMAKNGPPGMPPP